MTTARPCSRTWRSWSAARTNEVPDHCGVRLGFPPPASRASEAVHDGVARALSTRSAGRRVRRDEPLAGTVAHPPPDQQLHLLADVELQLTGWASDVPPRQ